MSTELKSIPGRHEKTELAPRGGYETVYSDSAMSLTRFAGGPENGPMLQVTLPQHGDSYFSHIQLNRAQIQELIDELRANFDLQ